MAMNRTLWMLVLLAATLSAEARIKLVALPERARLVVALDQPGAALVQEERVVTLQKGVNDIDFSWQGVSIAADSVQIRVLDHPDEVVVLNTSYPPAENSLVWGVSSPTAREARVRIVYLLYGLSRENVYKATADAAEKGIDLRHYARLHNNSGEELTGAQLRLERGRVLEKDIAHGEVVEMLLDRVDAIPIRKILTWDSASMPWDPEYQHETPGIPLTYVMKNDRASKLGEGPILDGKARIFLATPGSGGRENVAFTGEDWVTLTPADRELKLNIGQSRDVKVTQRQVKNDRQNIRRNNSNRDVLWDTDEEIKVEIENFKKDAVTLVLVQHIPGYWKMQKSSHEFRRKDAYTIEYELVLKPESKEAVLLHYNRLNVQGDEPKRY
jgi:hypothetical protein